MKFLLASVASQLSQSVVSLAATLVFAHVLSPNSFGVLSAFWLAWMLLMSLMRSAFGEQIVVRGVDHPESIGYADFAFVTATLCFSMSCGMLLLLNRTELFLGILFLSTFVLSDAIRYIKLAKIATEGSSSLMLFTDLTRLVLASFGLLAIWFLGGAQIAVSCMCAAGAVWVLFGVIEARGISPIRAFRFVRTIGDFERKLLTQFFLSTGMTQSMPYLALAGFGPASLGTLRLGQSILSPISLLTTSLQPKLLTFLASRPGPRAQRSALLKLMGCFTVIASVFGLLSISLYDVLLKFLLPENFQAPVGEILLPLVVLLSVTVVAQPGGAVIRVLRLGTVSLAGQLAGLFATGFFALVALQYSFVHFAWALTLGGCTTILVTYYLLFRHLRKSRRGRHA